MTSLIPAFGLSSGMMGPLKDNMFPMGIVSSGTYAVNGDHITIQQIKHTLGFVGEFKGLFTIEDNEMRMALATGPGQERPADLSAARKYIKH